MPRARRTALIVASVPELTMRTISTEGTASMTISGQLDFEVGRSAETGAPFEHIPDRLDDRRMPVPQYHRPPRADVIDVGVSVGVEDPAALGAVDKEWIGTDRFTGANRTVDAARDAGQCLLIKELRPLKIHFFHPFRIARHRLWGGGLQPAAISPGNGSAARIEFKKTAKSG